jgi:hypothetical protein
VFHTSFSRHGNPQASLVLLVWLKKTVVNTVVLLHVDSLVLSIMLRKVERKLLLDLLGIDGGRNLSFADVALARQNERVPFALALRNVGLALVEHRQHGIIYIVIEEDDALLGRADEVGNGNEKEIY